MVTPAASLLLSLANLVSFRIGQLSPGFALATSIPFLVGWEVQFSYWLWTEFDVLVYGYDTEFFAQFVARLVLSGCLICL